LAEVLKINPQFAPAYARLSIDEVRLNNLTNALALPLKAEERQSGRLSSAERKNSSAAWQASASRESGKFAAQRWGGADHDEAVELWTALREGQRPALEIRATEGDPPKVAEGSVQRTKCGDDTHLMTVTLGNTDTSLAFRLQGPHMVGSSDTQWYGADHFSGCHHLDGLLTIVRYTPSEDDQFAGDIASIDDREDLPQALEARPNSPPATSNASPKSVFPATHEIRPDLKVH
jgi:hypothetical protein